MSDHERSKTAASSPGLDLSPPLSLLFHQAFPHCCTSKFGLIVSVSAHVSTDGSHPGMHRSRDQNEMKCSNSRPARVTTQASELLKQPIEQLASPQSDPALPLDSVLGPPRFGREDP